MNWSLLGIPARLGATSEINRTLRLMSTEDLDTTVSVEVISRAGVYVPVDLGNLEINASEVVDVPLQNLDLGRGSFGLKITSGAPIVAALLSEVRSGSVSDFMWSVPSPKFVTASFNIYGLEPTITMVGEEIRVRIQWRNRSGEIRAESLIGREILNWRVPANTRLISFTNLSGAQMACLGSPKMVLRMCRLRALPHLRALHVRFPTYL